MGYFSWRRYSAEIFAHINKMDVGVNLRHSTLSALIIECSEEDAIVLKLKFGDLTVIELDNIPKMA